MIEEKARRGDGCKDVPWVSGAEPTAIVPRCSIGGACDSARQRMSLQTVISQMILTTKLQEKLAPVGKSLLNKGCDGVPVPDVRLKYIIS